MSAERTVDCRLAEIMSDAQIPLENLAWTIDAYLMANGARLDTETRLLLAGARDCADRVAASVRQLARQQVALSPPQSQSPPQSPPQSPRSADAEDRTPVTA